MSEAPDDAVLRVINPGALATLQDRGRMGYQRYGVPQSGAMDAWTFAIACMLVGNDLNEAAIEFTLIGGTYGVESGACRAAVAGAFPVTLNGAAVPSYRAFDLQAGERGIGRAGEQRARDPGAAHEQKDCKHEPTPAPQEREVVGEMEALLAGVHGYLRKAVPATPAAAIGSRKGVRRTSVRYQVARPRGATWITSRGFS